MTNVHPSTVPRAARRVPRLCKIARQLMDGEILPDPPERPPKGAIARCRCQGKGKDKDKDGDKGDKSDRHDRDRRERRSRSRDRDRRHARLAADLFKILLGMRQ
eukprot:Skav214449  [mRNA]  locus=scaffold1870:10773:11732:+ [translate_table: standard]